MNGIVKQFLFEQDEPLRLDKFLKEKVAGFSRSQLQSLIETGKVWVDDEIVLKPAFKLEQGKTCVLSCRNRNKSRYKRKIFRWR